MMAVCLVPAASASAQDKSEATIPSQANIAYSLLTFEDLAYLTPLGPQERREFLKLELAQLIEDHGLTLTGQEQSALIDS